MNKPAILKEIIEGRRSIMPKSYSDSEIDAEVLKEILNSANFAPNHKKTKPWRFKLFQQSAKTELAKKLAEIYKDSVSGEQFLEKKYQSIFDKAEKSGAIITISVNFSGLVPEWEEIAAVAMAVQNMYLTATAHHIGCYWSTPKMVAYLDDFLGLENNQKCYGLFYLGSLD